MPIPERYLFDMAVASSFFEGFCFFAFLPRQREVMEMYVTWEEMLLFFALILALLSFVVDIYNKKR